MKMTMKQMLKILFGFSLFIILYTACDKDVELTVLKHISFPSAITVSTNEIIITEDNLTNELLTVTWPAVDYTIEASVTYSVQFDLPSDTAGTDDWGNGKTTKVGADILTKVFKGSDLNKIAISLGMETNTPGTLIVRVKSYVDRDAYSDPLTLTITPYEKVVVVNKSTLWVPGDFQDWNPSTAPTLYSPNLDNLFEGYIYIPADGTNQFKFTAQAAWTPTTYGDGGSGTMVATTSSGTSFTAPSDGYYMLTANLTTMKYTMLKTTWSIIGDATSGGWTTDTPLEFDQTSQVWKVTTDLSSGGSYKFRANNSWTLDFGIDGEGNIKYADHPVLGYTAGLLNLSVTESGNYTITLDLHDASNYNYTIKKN